MLFYTIKALNGKHTFLGDFFQPTYTLEDNTEPDRASYDFLIGADGSVYEVSYP